MKLKDFIYKGGVALKLFSYVLILFFLTSVSYSKINIDKKKEKLVKDLIKSISEDDLIFTLRSFVSSGKPNRMVGSTGHQNSLSYLRTILEKDARVTISVSTQDFIPDINYAISFYNKDFEDKVVSAYPTGSKIYNKWDRFTKGIVSNLKKLKGVKGRNLLWEKKGTDQRLAPLILGAHYDTIGFNRKDLTIIKDLKMEGADDNGTGVSILLNIIKLLRDVEIRRTVKIVFFDFQELGLLGSRAYAKSLDKDSIYGFIGVEMLGHDSLFYDKSKKNFNMKLYIRRPSSLGAVKDSALAKKMLEAGTLFNRRIKFSLSATGHDSGDHYSFWIRGMPAVVFTQDIENDFNSKGNNSSEDFVEAVNFKTFYNSFQFIAGSVIYNLL